MAAFLLRKRILMYFLLAIVAVLLVFAVLAAIFQTGPAGPADIGVTFSDKYAAELGLDWREVFTATLDDLKVRKYRIPVYWDEVEAKRGTYDWSKVDWMLDEAAKRDAEVILVLGRKVPRWPECHIPAWAARLEETDQQKQVLDLLRREIGHFKTFPAVKTWQVENEPLFYFGDCPSPDRDFLKSEIELVHSLDTRPVMVTDSGELSTWARTATLGDVLGISLYRLVWNKYLGFLFWPVSPRYYSDHVALIKPLVKEHKIIISELQAEPWFSKPIGQTPMSEQYASMSPTRMRDNVDFARRTGMSEIYLWGAEWWYWARERGDASFWLTAKSLIR